MSAHYTAHVKLALESLDHFLLDMLLNILLTAHFDVTLASSQERHSFIQKLFCLLHKITNILFIKAIFEFVTLFQLFLQIQTILLLIALTSPLFLNWDLRVEMTLEHFGAVPIHEIGGKD